MRTLCLEADCTGQHIKQVNTTTGECISCFPCPPCNSGYSSSVRCGTNVSFGTDIKCVLLSTVHPTSSSRASTRSSINGTDTSDTTKTQKSEKELALAEWKKDPRIYIFGGIFLAVTLVAVVYKIRRKSRKQLSQQRGDRRHHNGCTSEIGDGNQRPQGFAAQGSSEGKSKSSDLVVVPGKE